MDQLKTRIAHLSGSTATIQNTPPLVTSNKARTRHNLPLRTNPDGSQARFDVLRAQRLAAPAKVYVEQFSAHPLESDAAELYGPPDGYLDTAGQFHQERCSPGDKPVYEIELHPDDGLYPMPYMARQNDGSAWEEECAFPGAPREKARQGFFPDGSRSFEEIDRLHVGEAGVGNLIGGRADVTFFRVSPPAGYTKAEPPERAGIDFFPYKPYHLTMPAPRQSLARIVNAVTEILGADSYDGAIWTEGSPIIEETLYWLNLLIDVKVPICGNAAQRPHGQISNDGPKNIVDSVEYIASRIWADDDGRNRAGVVLIAEQRVFAARAVMKIDARPGGFTATGGHGGVLGAVGYDGPATLHYLPTTLNTFRSEVNLSRLPSEVTGIRKKAERLQGVPFPIKDDRGRLLESAIPSVSIVKDGNYRSDAYSVDPNCDIDLSSAIGHMLENEPLCGFVVEGLTPYGFMTSPARNRLMMQAIYSGIPVVRVGRGNTEGFARAIPPFIGGSNLTATKARMLLMAALMKLGSLPPAKDPRKPTLEEAASTREKVSAFQRLFDTH